MEGNIDRNDGRLHIRVNESTTPAGFTDEEWQALSEDDSIESLVLMSRALGVPDSETRQIGIAVINDKVRLEEFLALLDGNHGMQAG